MSKHGTVRHRVVTVYRPAVWSRTGEEERNGSGWLESKRPGKRRLAEPSTVQSSDVSLKLHVHSRGIHVWMFMFGP